MTENANELGHWAEQQALIYLQQFQYECVAQNYHSRYGEIDLIVKRQNELIFVEIKARSAGSYAESCEVITRSQQRKIIKTKYPHYSEYYCRFDVICFDFPQKIAKTVQPDFSKLQYDQQWIEHAFTLD